MKIALIIISKIQLEIKEKSEAKEKAESRRCRGNLHLNKKSYSTIFIYFFVTTHFTCVFGVLK